MAKATSFTDYSIDINFVFFTIFFYSSHDIRKTIFLGQGKTTIKILR